MLSLTQGEITHLLYGRTAAQEGNEGHISRTLFLRLPSSGPCQAI